MAEEIQPSFSATIENGNFSDTIDTQEAKWDQAAQGGGVPGTISVATSEQTISFTGLTDPGCVFIKNLDLSNYVRYGPKKTDGNAQFFGRIRPGKWAWVELDPSVSLVIKADTAPCKVQIKAYER